MQALAHFEYVVTSGCEREMMHGRLSGEVAGTKLGDGIYFRVNDHLTKIRTRTYLINFPPHQPATKSPLLLLKTSILSISALARFDPNKSTHHTANFFLKPDHCKSQTRELS